MPLRYVLAFAAPTVLAVGGFLKEHGIPAPQAEAVQRAWTKCVMLQVALWSRPYVREGLW